MKINNLTIRRYKVPYCDNRITYYVISPAKKTLESFITEEGAISFATETLDFCSKRYIKTLVKREVRRLNGWMIQKRKHRFEVNFSTKEDAEEFVNFCNKRAIFNSSYTCGYKRYYVEIELGEY